MYICSNCHWGYLMQHGTHYVRCGICGYTEELNKEKMDKFMLLYRNGKKEGEDGV